MRAICYVCVACYFKEHAMEYVASLVDHVTSAAQSWSPMQLMIVAAITILLGYLGIASRLASR